ncbi:MAG TPA: protein kinase, partial [Gemmataceae bacterium]|nr:protein kinase [Gemmataceae bacterium]
RPNQRVALKFVGVGASITQKMLDRFEREADILKQLKHPNIVRLIGHGRHRKKIPYYAMEYVEGQTLADVLSRRGRLPWEEVVALGKQLCAALHHAHEQGIIHRDVKPSNLMVLRDGTLKLTDFGIAKDLDVTALTEANCTVGTASYMSPEQCKGERNLTHRSDLYSLGIVLYELLTGQKPFEAESAMDMFLMHVQGKFERPSRLVMDIPPWLDTLVCQLLEKKPDKRPFDAAVAGAALDQVVEKVSAQRSAGVDALTGTRAVTASRTLAGEDREAARTLAQSLGKGTKKKRKKAFYKRAWFQAIWIGLALLLIGGLILYAVQPPSPDILYARAERLVKKGDKANARDDPIAKYLKFHARKMAGTDQLKQVQAWADEIDTEQREAALLNRMKVNVTPDTSSESAARKAITQEEAGDFNDARATWQGLLKYETEPSEQGDRVIALVAKKRLRDLQAAEDRLLKVQQKVDLIRAGQTDLKPDSDSEEIAIEAMRFEKLGDAALAARRWSKLRIKNEKEGGDRTWFLIAAREAKEQKAKAPKDADEQKARDELLQSRLDKARELAAGEMKDKQEALRILYEVRLLYRNEDKVKDKVERAREMITKLGGS